MTRSWIYLIFLCTLATLMGALLFQGRQTATLHRTTALPAKLQLVRSLGLTDLSIWTEARYTRHPSQADLFTPFQDYPAAADHFPAGSIIAAGPAEPATSIRVKKMEQP